MRYTLTNAEVGKMQPELKYKEGAMVTIIKTIIVWFPFVFNKEHYNRKIK